MKVEQFLQDFFKEDDEIVVNCAWLQKQLMDAVKYHHEFKNKDQHITSLEYKINKLQAKITLMEIEKPLRLDVSV